jgi:hypothetical protein
MNAKTAEKNAPADEKKHATDISVRSTGSAVAVAEDYGTDAGKGMENISADERKVPFVRLLQSNSPQCVDDGNAKFMPHAKPGMFLNTSTGQLFNRLGMIPCARDHKFVEYVPRDLGSGFVAIHEPGSELILMLRAKQGKFGKLGHDLVRDAKGTITAGTEIIEGFQLYAIFFDPDSSTKFRGVYSFTSTQIGKYQSWVDRYDSITYRTSAGEDGKVIKPPMWAHKWLLTSANEKNKKGAFKGVVVGLFEKNTDGSDAEPIKSLIKMSDPLYAEGKAFNAFVEAGKGVADYEGDAKKGGAAETEVEM